MTTDLDPPLQKKEEERIVSQQVLAFASTFLSSQNAVMHFENNYLMVPFYKKTSIHLFPNFNTNPDIYRYIRPTYIMLNLPLCITQDIKVGFLYMLNSI